MSELAPAPLPPSPSPSLHEWLADLYRFAGKPDQNLGRSSIGPMPHRITARSAESLMKAFAHVDNRHYLDMLRTFVDLGCARGLVCATAIAHVPNIKRVLGWDIDESEVCWARQHVVAPESSLVCPPRVKFEFANALEFCAARDLRTFYDYSPPGRPKQLADNESVWIYAFWLDWGEQARLEIAKHLFFEDGFHWSVFACSDKDLFSLVAQDDERVLEFLHENYRRHEVTAKVYLSQSGEEHRIYFYVKRHF